SGNTKLTLDLEFSSGDRKRPRVGVPRARNLPQHVELKVTDRFAVDVKVGCGQHQLVNRDFATCSAAVDDLIARRRKRVRDHALWCGPSVFAFDRNRHTRTRGESRSKLPELLGAAIIELVRFVTSIKCFYRPARDLARARGGREYDGLAPSLTGSAAARSISDALWVTAGFWIAVWVKTDSCVARVARCTNEDAFHTREEVAAFLSTLLQNLCIIH